MKQENLLEVVGLRTSFFTREGEVRAVNGVSFSLKPGEILGIVGESGSGKSITAYSLMGLIDQPGRIVGGQVNFAGENLLTLSAEQMRRKRGCDIAMVFQDPSLTLNPTLRIDTQMIETVRAHKKLSREAARVMCLDALKKVGIPAPEERLEQYPHQLSGGLRQRIAIAIALLLEPALIIADEPTTALDVTTQTQVLYEMQKLCRGIGSALIWITHDLSLLAEIADRICVMYGGKIVEEGTVDDIIDHPAHPYTEALLASLPSKSRRGRALKQIKGMTPSFLDLPPGCAFSPRCSYGDAHCETPPLMTQVSRTHTSLCCHVKRVGS